MQITLLCTSPEHPVNDWLARWQALHQVNHDITLCRDKGDLPGGDILFLISCSQIIDAATRASYRYTLVLHASDLPRGRGWSPHVWALLEGAEAITVSLLNAEDGVDTGAIWAKRTIPIPAHALYDEIHCLLFDTELALMDEALQLISAGCEPVPQPLHFHPTYYRKRTPLDSEIDPRRPLSELFSTIRVMDPQRYPAFFRLHGHIYTIEFKKVTNHEDN
ncbi:UDP-glucuronic acid dehydrogenase [Billgrantia pellis]|uniref:UDP-glucuronic acid dehydrogenase n=1 Tax=Billgrantia pellis TaxID=2606936 RepID=A0A7V7G3E8_9GAMM|nr:formyltransferase family protein [Halomonas pellis]KAA0014607.1 UDP-glucuronic acid dehydrogenase [Halomonas pellis]